jgi:hypothetical protein
MPQVAGVDRTTRRYEYHMEQAFAFYALSREQASEIEKDGGFAEQHGGSAHGAVEAVYRLHASRLKCLLSAVDRWEDERDDAVLEALRLTESHWNLDPGNLSDKTPRERLWIVFADVVAALAKCSQDYSFFHRSVYRHAQALMWAPVVCDPLAGSVAGSLGIVPEALASSVKGLNHTGNAASCATITLSSLFVKKRAQLVSVWVTGDGTASIFQALNSTVRKYDSLRGKYIAGYIDCLRLGRKRKELDTFLSWTISSPNDLPSYFAASASIQRDRPMPLPGRDNLLLRNRPKSLQHLLTSVRRLANGALANVILQDLNDPAIEHSHAKPAERANYLETQLKLAYACFLRLNCDVESVVKSRYWKYDRKNGIKDVVEALSAAYLKIQKPDTGAGLNSSWSVESQVVSAFQAAVCKCKELYPTLSGSFSFSKPRVTKRPSTGQKTRRTATKGTGSPLPVKRSFEVAVPEGLSEGETFLTSVQIGDNVKKLRLTVPPGDATTLQFSLEVPAASEAAPSSKEDQSERRMERGS